MRIRSEHDGLDQGGPDGSDDPEDTGELRESDPTATATEPSEGERAPLPRSTIALLVLVGLLAIPHVVAICVAAGTGWVPSGDQALEILRMHDVGSSHTPLLGVYSRFGWNHPGPLLFWVNGPVLHLFGPAGVLAFTGVLNLTWALVAIAAARRLGGDALAIVVTACLSLAVAAQGAELITDVWNPWIALPAVICFVFTVAAFAQTGGRWTLLAAVVAGSYAVQAHIGCAPLVGAAAAGAVVWCWRARPPVARPLRLAGAALGLGLLLWSGPIVQQVRGPDGNLSALVNFATEGTQEPTPTTKVALSISAREVGAIPAWMGANEKGYLGVQGADAWTLLIAPVALGALAFAARRRDPVVVRASAYALLLHVATIFAVSRTSGGLFSYVLRWSWATSIFAVATIVWSAWRLAGLARTGWATSTVAARSDAPAEDRSEPEPDGVPVPSGGSWPSPGRVPSRVAFAVAVAVVVVSAGPTTRTAITTRMVPDPRLSHATQEVVSRVEPNLPKGRYNVRWNHGFGFSSVATGVFAHLARHGYDLRYLPDFATSVGDFRVGDDPTVPTIWVIGSEHGWTAPPGARRIADWTPLPAEDHARKIELEARLRRQTGTPPGEPVQWDRLPELSPEVLQTLADMAKAGDVGENYEVFVVPAVEG